MFFTYLIWEIIRELAKETRNEELFPLIELFAKVNLQTKPFGIWAWDDFEIYEENGLVMVMMGIVKSVRNARNFFVLFSVASRRLKNYGHISPWTVQILE